MIYGIVTDESVCFREKCPSRGPAVHVEVGTLLVWLCRDKARSQCNVWKVMDGEYAGYLTSVDMTYIKPVDALTTLAMQKD